MSNSVQVSETPATGWLRERGIAPRVPADGLAATAGRRALADER